jgi:hypothetical protein
MALCCCWVLKRWWLGRPLMYRCLLGMADIKAQHCCLITGHQPTLTSLLHQGSKVLHHQGFRVLLVVWKEGKGEIIRRVIISDTTTLLYTTCHQLHSSSYIQVNFQFSSWNCVSILLFFYLSQLLLHIYVPIIYCVVNWCRAAVGFCPQILHHRHFNFCCPSCITKSPSTTSWFHLL